MRKVLICLLMVFLTSDASAQAPMAVSVHILIKHRLKSVPPEYPASALRAHVSGTVVLRIVVGPQGNVTAVKTVSGPVLLRGAAESSVKQWRFKPFMKGGEAVAATGDVNLIFSLGSASPPTPLQSFLGRMLPKYVRETELVDRGYSCEVVPAWKELPAVRLVPPDSPVLKWLEGTKLYVVMKAGYAPNTSAETPDKPELNAGEMAAARRAVRSARGLETAFSLSWVQLGIYELPVVPSSKLQRTGGKTEVVFVDQGVTNRETFDKNLVLIDFMQAYPDGLKVDQTPRFENTSKGLLYTGTDLVIGQPGHERRLSYSVDYQELGKFHLPKTMKVGWPGSEGAVHFQFRDCKVNPPAPVPPPTRLNKNTVIVHIRPQ